MNMNERINEKICNAMNALIASKSELEEVASMLAGIDCEQLHRAVDSINKIEEVLAIVGPMTQ